jgi:cystathionine beta-lyase/cystathionine gamma-synthase
MARAKTSHSKYNLSTRAIHAAGLGEAPVRPGVGPPIVPASVYAFSTLEELAEVAAGRGDDRAYYRRYGHLNATMLERAVASLENGEEALATTAGMSAIMSIVATTVKHGDHVVASKDLYGGTVATFQRDLSNVTWVKPDAVARAITRRTKLIVIETIANPLMTVGPIEEIARVKGRALLMVDNTFATAYHCRPLERGADVSVVSGTKFLGGHADAVCGVAVGASSIIRPARKHAMHHGLAASPLDAWLVLRGVKTLAVRMERASRTALALARYLFAHPRVAKVYYPGLTPTTVLERGFGAMLSFELKGGRPAVSRFVRAARLIRLVPSLGDVSTTITHPASSSHAYLTPAQRRSFGISDGLVRLSVGLEDLDDLVGDLDRALKGAR